jgi:hypothetical protein
MHVLAMLLDGRQFELCVSSSDSGSAVKELISTEIGKNHAEAGRGKISCSRLKLVAGSQVFGDLDTIEACGIQEGDAITVIVLSPLQGSLKISGLDVPLDVLEAKMEMNAAFAARVQGMNAVGAF